MSLRRKNDTCVVVPFYNNRKTVVRTARSLLGCDPRPDRIIFVDDGSTDGSAGTLDGLEIQLIRSKHIGRPAALNLGIANSTESLVLFTDADCVVPPDWVNEYLAAFLREPEFDGIGGNLLPSTWNSVETGKVLRYVHEFQERMILEGQYDGVCLNGNNMAIRRAVLEKTGGFDEGYFHGADADLTRRMLQGGSRLLRSPDITTRHLKVDGWAGFMRTCFKRGSTIRFSRRDDGALEKTGALREWLIAPGVNFLRDIMRIPALSVFDTKKFWWPLGIGGALASLVGSWFNSAGRRHYLHKWEQEEGRRL